MSAFSLNLLPILFVFATPLLLGGLLLYIAFQPRGKRVQIASGLFGLLCLPGGVWAVILAMPYIWASHLESRWSPANPKFKAELESYLSLYSQQDIQTSQSEWGCNCQLKPGERMVQYRLLWAAPLDVVYSGNDAIAAIYTSYE